MDLLLAMKAWVRPGVFVDSTTISADKGGRGAFAPRHGVTRKASFIGVYRATNWRRSSGDSKYRGSNDYTFQVGSWRAAPGKKLNLASFKMMAVQEPPEGVTANCAFIFFSKAGQVGAPMAKSASIALVALYAARDLAPGEELFAHYGDDKNRSYEVGAPAELFKYEIPATEYPVHWTLHGAAADGWRPR
jgi:hypothetical protein